MIYIIKPNQLGLLEYSESEILYTVDYDLYGDGGRMWIEPWGPVYLVEADEEFATYSALRFGISILRLTGSEYSDLTQAKVVFFSKTRTTQLRDFFNVKKKTTRYYS